MRNPDYNPEAFATQTRVYADTFASLEAQMAKFTGELEDPQDAYHPYATDHADEKLGQLAGDLRKLADRLENLRKYTNYPATSPVRALGWSRGH